MNTIERRIVSARRRAAVFQNMVTKAKRMRAEGKSNLHIAMALDIPENTVRILGRDR